MKWKLAAILTVILFSSTSQAQDISGGSRAQGWDFYIGPQYIDSQTLHFDGGAAADIESRASLLFGVGYHFDEHFALDFMFSSSSANYTGTARSDSGETQTFVADMYTSSFNLAATYYLLTGRFTPYLTGNVGFTYIDSGIPTGEVTEGCWWDPWYGYECYPYARTYNSNKFNYGLQAGLRYDFENHVFLKAGGGINTVDLDTRDTTTFVLYNVVVGFMFK